MNVTHQVAISPCNTYHPEEVSEALQACLEAIAFATPRGSRVLIKPNALTNNTPDQATGTHPAVLEAVCAWLADAGCRLAVGDSSAYFFPGYTRRSFQTLGFEAVARRFAAELLCFEEQPFVQIERSSGELPLYVADLSGFDLVVNLPKLKVHRITRLSAAVKNLFGCVPGGTKQLYHEELKQRPDYLERMAATINDVYDHLRPGLNVLDGIVGLERDGPAANGDPRRTRFLMASGDALALDVALCGVIGEQPGAVTTIRDALARGWIVPAQVHLAGRAPRVEFALLQERPRPGRLTRWLSDGVMGQLIVEPRLDAEKCARCGECAQRCFVDAIHLDPAPRFDLAACIRCYGCPSYCPQGAIHLDGSPVYRALQGVRRLTGI